MSQPEARASLEIPASIDRVWQVLTALDQYGAWNPFIVKVDGGATPVLGGRLVLHVKWEQGGGASSGEVVTRVEPPGTSAALAWRFTGVLPTLGLVRAERLQTLTRLDDVRTRYESVEIFHGLLASFVPLEKVRRGFERQAEALRDAAR
ncbi:MAG: SRPBCC domain-containing protein [Archangiaceae bacterium]|nr:SRPBCC domain-containing protein [Archangiaceae bacterium]